MMPNGLPCLAASSVLAPGSSTENDGELCFPLLLFPVQILVGMGHCSCEQHSPKMKEKYRLKQRWDSSFNHQMSKQQIMDSTQWWWGDEKAGTLVCWRNANWHSREGRHFDILTGGTFSLSLQFSLQFCSMNLFYRYIHTKTNTAYEDIQWSFGHNNKRLGTFKGPAKMDWLNKVSSCEALETKAGLYLLIRNEFHDAK